MNPNRHLTKAVVALPALGGILRGDTVVFQPCEPCGDRVAIYRPLSEKWL